MEIQTSTLCPRCRAPIPEASGETLCASCSVEDGATVDLTPTPRPEGTSAKGSKRPGSTLEPEAVSSGQHATLTSMPVAVPGLPELSAAFLARYEIKGLLGQGGMGNVYLAVNREAGMEVAIKLAKGMAHGTLERFRAEYRILGRLAHRAIVRLYDAGMDSANPYFVMQLVRAPTLRQRRSSEPMPPTHVARVMVDVLEGLEYAHSQGVLHRDIKPENIFVETDLDGQPRGLVADFGLARSHSVAGAGVRAGEISGTPGYMPPEQARGQPMDERGDVYAVGVTMYELLAGRRPFTGHSLAEVLRATVDRDPPPLSTFAADIAPALEDIVMKAVARAAEVRFASARQMRESLIRWLGLDRELLPVGPVPDVPYRVLRPLEAGDRGIFFGRDEEVCDLVARLEDPRRRVIYLYGPCGAGKSSLVRAGLAGRLDPARFEPLVVTSGSDPLGALAHGLVALAARRGVDRIGDAPLLASRLAAEPDLVFDLVNAIAQRGGRTLVVVLDQLEEVYTLDPAGAERARALAGRLRSLVAAEAVRIRLVLSFRQEFLAEFLDLAQGGLGVDPERVRLREMGADGLMEAIEGPTRHPAYGFAYERGLVERIAADVLETTHRRGQSAPPVMQIVCAALYGRMKEKGQSQVTRDLYESAVGGAAGALERYVEDTLTDPALAPRQAMARQILKALTIKEEGHERFSRAREEVEVLEFADPDAARRTLEALIGRHLVVREAAEDGRRMVRLASEVVCPLIDGWADAPDEAERAARALARGYRQWLEGGRRPDDLLGGGVLRLVTGQVANLHALGEGQRQYIKASHARHRRRVAVGSAAAAAFLLMIASIVYARTFKPGIVILRFAPPDATVHIDGRELPERAGRLGRSLWPGSYVLSVSRDRFITTVAALEIPVGGEVHRSISLEPITASLLIDAPQEGAQVTVEPLEPGLDGFTQTLPMRREAKVKLGRYRVRLGGRGYRSREETLEVKAPGTIDRTVWVDPVLPIGTANVPFSHAGHVAIGDLDGDGVPDAVCTAKGPRGAVAGVADVPDEVVVVSGRTWLVAWTLPTELSRATAPTVADLDGDGRPEAVVGGSPVGQGPSLVAISGGAGGGRLLWRSRLGVAIRGMPVVGDLDGDGRPEVVAPGSDGRVYALAGATGVVIWTRDLSTPVRTVALGSLDAQPGLDVAVGSGDGRLVALSGRQGTHLWSLDVTPPGRPSPPPSSRGGGSVTVDVLGDSSPALADLDGDGQCDVAVGTMHGIVAAEGRSGRMLWNVPTTVRAGPSPAVGDLDGDGLADVVAGSNDGCIYALRGRDGSELWRHYDDPGTPSNPLLADLDGDRVPDVVVGLPGGTVTVLDGRSGRPMSSWATMGPVRATPALVELDGDGVLDVVARAPDGDVVAMTGGMGRVGWTWPLEGAVTGPPRLADLDGDGAEDVLIPVSKETSSGERRGVRMRAGTSASRLVAVSGRTGTRLWMAAMSQLPGGPLALTDLDGDARPDVVSVTGGSVVAAISGVSGRPLWMLPSVGPEYGSVQPLLAVPGGRLLLLGHGQKGELWAIEAPELRRVWSADLGAPVDSVLGLQCLDGDATLDAVVADRNGVVMAVSGATGRRLWSLATGSRTLRATATRDLDGDRVADLILGMPDVLGGDGSAASGARAPPWRPVYPTVAAVSGASGRPLWAVPSGALQHDTYPTCADVDGDTTPDAVVRIGSGTLAAFAGRGGRQLWTAAGAPLDWPRHPTLAMLPESRFPVVLTASERGDGVRVLSARDGSALRLGVEPLAPGQRLVWVAVLPTRDMGGAPEAAGCRQSGWGGGAEVGGRRPTEVLALAQTVRGGGRGSVVLIKRLWRTAGRAPDPVTISTYRHEAGGARDARATR